MDVWEGVWEGGGGALCVTCEFATGGKGPTCVMVAGMPVLLLFIATKKAGYFLLYVCVAVNLIGVGGRI